MRPRIRRTRQGWEVLRDGAILGPYRTRAEAERWAKRVEVLALMEAEPLDNPRPAAWGNLRGSTPYPCKARAVGKTVRRQGRAFTVESCATPAKAKPAVGQFWLTSGGKGHAVPRPAVSRALRRGARPPSADLFSRGGRAPSRFGAGSPEPSRPFAAPRPQQGAKLVGFREVETAELVDEWEGRVLQPSERWRVELWVRSSQYSGPLHEAIAYRWHPEEGRWVNEARADENAPYNGIISVVAHRSWMRMPPEAHDALDDLIRTKAPGLPYQRLERLAKGGLRTSSGGRGAYAPRAENEFKDRDLQVVWRAYNARACVEEDRRGTREERRAKELAAEHRANAALELACGQPGSLPPTKDCARLYGLLGEVWEGARCNVSELEEPPCPRRLTDDRLGAWARGEEPLPPRGPFDVHTEHQAGGAGGCCAYSEPQVRRASLHRRALADLRPGQDPEDVLAEAEGYADRRDRELWAKCDERVRREVEKRRAALATGAEGSGGETGLELLLGWWRAARKGDTERAYLLGSRAISEGEVKYDPAPGWESEPGDATMMDALLEALASSPSSSQRKRAILAELERGSTGRITPAIRARVLGATVRREMASRAQRAHAGRWKRGR